jgi:acylphosphatase
MLTMIRKTVLYSGHVQGVGFRYAVNRAAGGFSVTGFVRNLPDGRVELVAEGQADQVDSLIAEVDRELGPFIHDAKISTTPTPGHYDSFDIAY